MSTIVFVSPRKSGKMGVSYFCFGNISSPQRFSKEEFDHQNHSRTSSVLDFMKPKCLWGEKNSWKKLGNSNKEQKQKKPQQIKLVKKELTLEEWFSASSPCGEEDYSLCSSGGSYYNSEHSWVVASKNSRDSFSSETLLTIKVLDGGKSDAYAPCLCRSDSSGKVKKRVSFKLPEEADIFIFSSTPNQADSESE